MPCSVELHGVAERGLYSGNVNKDGTPHHIGRHRATFDCSDGRRFQGSFDNGILKGPKCIEYYAKGTIKYGGNFEDGEWHGQGTWYYENKYVGMWSKGLQHGEGEVYGPDGKLLMEGTWSDGKFMSGTDTSDETADAPLPDATEIASSTPKKSASRPKETWTITKNKNRKVDKGRPQGSVKSTSWERNKYAGL